MIPGGAITQCAIGGCRSKAQPEHAPCCSSSFHAGRGLCCKHYCRYHFVEVDICSPETHAVGIAS